MLPLQQPAQITNGRVEMRGGSTIEREIAAAAQQGEPSWVAWKVPAVEGRGQGCCWYSNNNTHWYGCGVEPATPGAAAARPQQPTGPVPLEAGTTLLVMARVVSQPGGSAAGGNVERVRTFGDDCPIDAGGRTIRFLEQVSPDASVSWLRGYITASLAAEPKSSAYNNALSAIANTAGPAADAALDHFAAASQPSNVRRQAAFWIGQTRGSAGFAKLKSMLARETAADVRRTIIQAMSQSRQFEAVPTLLDIAKNDPDPANRGEALTWLARNAGQKVTADITAAIANDPDTKVQERAVQALSHLPKDEGVPALIQVARTHKNAKVRERAMFWLGQSKDPRATKFFEEILISR
ncbi:MAG TPA: HEAT repeat domain-containing protein [Vicinamibacterales bacterium]|nr:HEAT repeat domain-containing protein [Vicinamibacterales bacterium]